MSLVNRPKIRLNARILPFIISILFILQLLDPSRIWIMLLVGLGAAWLISYGWVRALSRDLLLNREMRFGWAQVGDQLEERFTLVNNSRLPALWVELIDHSTIPGNQPGRVTGVGGSSENSWQTQRICTQRGLYTIGPTSLIMGDPFGLYNLHLYDPASIKLTVMPPIVPLPEIEVASGGRVGESRSRPNTLERTVSVNTVRDFSPGDSLRHIHWPTSARRNQLFVRVFDTSTSSNWWIILDMDQQVQVGQGESSTEEHAVILAASLVDRGLRMGNSVGLVTHGTDLVWQPPQEGIENRWKILSSLALVHPGSYSLKTLLSNISPSLGQRASLVLITPNISGEWLESLLPLLWRGAVATVLLLEPYSFGGTGDSHNLGRSLDQWNITHYNITSDLLNRPEAHPGQSGRWEWHILPSGQAVPVRRPAHLDWKSLT